MLPIDNESANLCTFNTPFGRNSFIRLPYGLNCASNVFYRVMTGHFSDIDGVFAYLDDLIIYAKPKEQHIFLIRSNLVFSLRHNMTSPQGINGIEGLFYLSFYIILYSDLYVFIVHPLYHNKIIFVLYELYNYCLLYCGNLTIFF